MGYIGLIAFIGWCHITNRYCNNTDCHLCTTWSTLASDSNIFFIPLQLDNTVNASPCNYFLNFPIPRRTVAASTKKLCLGFSIVDTVDLEMKEIGHRCIPSR